MRTIKRALDLIGAVIALMLTAPLLAASAVAIKLTMGSPVLFRQVRPGLGGAPFTIYKFRTMLPAPENGIPTPPDKERLNALGRFLRATSLDELPELINVLKGEMSLVGPRPLRMAYLEHYTPEQARRHEIKPGITGWAQINGRNAIDWQARFKLDVWYVDHHSFALDLRILCLTLVKVLRRDNVINEAGDFNREPSNAKNTIR